MPTGTPVRIAMPTATPTTRCADRALTDRGKIADE
jgi:hypothetical protein